MVLIKLFLAFLKIGAFTFGGGYAMIAMIQAEAERQGWLTQEELVDFVALSESTPGPLAVNMATFVGIRTGGVLSFGYQHICFFFCELLDIPRIIRSYHHACVQKGTPDQDHYSVCSNRCRCRIRTGTVTTFTKENRYDRNSTCSTERI